MKDKIILYGASGHGLVVADILELSGFPNILFYDDNKVGNFKHYSLISQPDMIVFFRVIITIGSNEIRQRIAESYNFSYINAIHPSAIIAKSSQIGTGNVLMAGAKLGVFTKIGNHCIINTGANIDHECQLDDFCHISPGVSLAGNVSVGEGAHVGIGASVIQGVKIGKWATVGAGAVVIRDVPDFATVVGVPGRVIK